MGDSADKWTREQKMAIKTQSKRLLVSAAAGAGKTSVLVQRVIDSVLSPKNPCDIERLLVVTFTDKAASEMKDRVRNALEKAVQESPYDARILRQISLLDRAHISTIHSFCLHVVRRYFHKLNLDPSFKVLDTDDAYILLLEAIDEVFDRYYEKNQKDFLDLVSKYGGYGIDEGLKSLVMDIYHFSTTQPDPQKWLNQSTAYFHRAWDGSRAKVLLHSPWSRVLIESATRDLSWCIDLTQKACGIARQEQGPGAYIDTLTNELSLYQKTKEALFSLHSEWEEANDLGEERLTNIRSLLSYEFDRLPNQKGCLPELKEKAKAFRDRAKTTFRGISKYAFLRLPSQVTQEIKDLSPEVDCLKSLIVDLDQVYSRKKLERPGLDFSDLERYCLKVLTMDDGRIASELRREYDQVLVDEYQDTNPIQDAILSVMVGEAETPSVFMVGDIKQSIYRFRLAEPRIFLSKLETYRPLRAEDSYDKGTFCDFDARVDLSLNFRSRREVVDFVNYVFSRIMRKDTAEVDYRNGHELRCGASYPEQGKEESPYIPELYLLDRDGKMASSKTGSFEGESALGSSGDDEAFETPSPNENSDSDAESPEEYEALEKEAMIVARRIKEMTDPEKPFLVWDSEAETERPVCFRDIAILMRATKERVNAVMEVLGKSGIPCASDAGTGYFQVYEIQIILSLLSVIDNPRQDIPLAAVLRSPIVGLSPQDLALVKSDYKLFSARKVSEKAESVSDNSVHKDFYDAILHYAQKERETGQKCEEQKAQDGSSDPIKERLCRFLSDLDGWRTKVRRLPLVKVLWTILRETGFYDYVGGLPGGSQRQANLRALLDRASQYDSMGRHGLFRFLQFIEKIRDREGDLGTARALGEKENVVEVLSIHRAKGLEFPVVFIMDLGRKFNANDLRKDILIHRDLGICPIYCDLDLKIKYPTIAYQACQVKILEDNLAEEMRILYVAMTRAKEKLILVGSARGLEGRMEAWKEGVQRNPQSFLDWVSPCVMPTADDKNGSSLVKVRFFGIDGYPDIPSSSEEKISGGGGKVLTLDDIRNLRPPKCPPDEVLQREIERRLTWVYPRSKFTTILGKMSVGQAKSRLDRDFSDDSLEGRFEDKLVFRPWDASPMDKSSALQRGIAVHTLLANIDLNIVSKSSQSALSNVIYEEYLRLSRLGVFEANQEIDEEDLSAVARFFTMPSGQLLLSERSGSRREAPFTLKVPLTHDSPDDFMVLQGVIDVLIEREKSLVIVDYKTDRAKPSSINFYAQKYAPQVSLYALAAEDILEKPVEKVIIVFLWPGLEVEINKDEEIGRALSLFTV